MIVLIVKKRSLSLDDLRDMNADEISAYLDQKGIGGTVKRLVRMVRMREKGFIQIPYYEVTGELQPVTNSIIRVSVHIHCDYEWTLRTHGPVSVVID